ncbi:MAG: PDDEXK nuclease domain-containing protein [Clostridia bacterium]
MKKLILNDENKDFCKIIELIEKSRENALRKVNEELIMRYWNVGKFLSNEIQNHNFGESYIDGIAKEIKENYPEIKGFNRRGLYRMKQFYETYKDNEFVSTLLTQISWSQHLAILSSSKSDEERQFYLNLSIKERYSVRELQRQIDSGYFQRYMLSKEKVGPLAVPEKIKNEFLDSYVLEFLDLPETFSEHDFQKAIIQNIKKFILEFGKDFTFIGEEYKVQVGGHDYFIDLLFYHRGLACLVAFELKIGAFKPEYIGKVNFYLEALDREHKKEHENPSVGVVLCSSKDDEVVEFAISRSLSPTLIAEYQTKLIDKDLLKQKLHEFSLLAENVDEEI